MNKVQIRSSILIPAWGLKLKALVTVSTLMSILLFTIPTAYAESISMVVNSASSIEKSSVTAKGVRNVFLGKTKKLGGVPVSPVAQVKTRAITVIFNENVVKKTESQARAYWSRMVFSGKASPPPELDDDQSVLLHVGENSSAIGYVKSSAVNDTVKVVLEISM